MPKLTVSMVFHVAMVFVFLGLLTASKMLYTKNIELTRTNIEITLVYEEKVKALNTCSVATEKLKTRERELTEAAKIAVAKAKLEADISYNSATEMLRKRPVQPKVTKENEKDFGGNDTMVQLKDYLAAQKLINDYIDDQEGK